MLFRSLGWVLGFGDPNPRNLWILVIADTALSASLPGLGEAALPVPEFAPVLMVALAARRSGGAGESPNCEALAFAESEDLIFWSVVKIREDDKLPAISSVIRVEVYMLSCSIYSSCFPPLPERAAGLITC